MREAYDLKRFVADLSMLEVGRSYRYASLTGESSSSCQLVSVNSTNGSVCYRRNGGNKVDKISSAMVHKMIVALDSRRAVECNSLFGGSGNFRSVIEALLVNTQSVFLCKIDGKKHIFWNPEATHRVGEIVVKEPPLEGAYTGERSLQITIPAKEFLDFALRQFEQHRSDDDWAGGYRAVNAGVREYFGKLTAEKIDGMDTAGLTELFEGVKDGEGRRTFMPMWSGSIGTGYGHIKGAIEVAADEVRAFLLRLQRDTALVSQFTRKDFARPGGFGKSVVSELLMKFHPDSALLYDSKTRDALKFLGCADFEPKADFDETEYTRVMGIAADIKSRMADMGIARTLEGAADARERVPPDYLTVNEFVAWVVDHKDLIKEKVMKEQLKPVAEKLTKYGKKGLKEALKDDEMLRRLAAALRTKPFAILAGHSGTGKSSLVRRLAYMTCADEELLKEADENTLPGNYCMVQVKPNWHDSIDLLGSYSDLGGRHYQTTPFVEFVCKAYAHPSVPFFVCLDEMNLAPVEHYFAEYLSAIESAELRGGVYMTDPVVSVDRDGEKKAKPDVLLQIMGKSASTNAADWLAKHDLTLPGNLFVVGTVNMDETTCQFSRKVLDRAMTILMDKVDFDSMAEDPVAKDEVLDKDAVDFFLGHKLKCGKLDAATQVARLNALKEPLANTPFAIAYRFANEYGLYQEAITQLLPDTEKSEASDIALDHLVLMKLLPRIHGERAAVRAIFTGEGGKSGLCAVLKDGLSKTQMMSILERKDEYLTFWP